MHQIRALFADETGVTTDKVAVVVQAAIPRRLQSQDTVNLDVIILCDTPAAATAIRSSLASTLSSAETASSFLATADVFVTEPPVVRQSTAIIDEDGQLQEQDPEEQIGGGKNGSGGLPAGAVAGIAIAMVVVCMALIALAVWSWRRQRVEVPLPPPPPPPPPDWPPPGDGSTSTSAASPAEIDVITVTTKSRREKHGPWSHVSIA